MGIFPYTCVACGGAYKRCCDKACEERPDCPGGQFCFSEDVVVVIAGKPIPGKYTGYGTVETKLGEVFLTEFHEAWKAWDEKPTDLVTGVIYCKECYKPEPKAKKVGTLRVPMKKSKDLAKD